MKAALVAFYGIMSLAQTVWGQAIAPAGQLLNYGASARSMAMGSANTAISGDVTSLYYNPAGLGLLDGRQMQLMQASLYGGASYDYIGYAQNFRQTAGGWGLQVLKLNAPGGLGTDVNNVSAGGFSYSEMAVGFGFGLRGIMLPDFSAGGNINALTRTLGNSSDRLIGAGLGAQYGPLFDGKLMFGANVENGLSLAQGKTSDKLPTTLHVGTAYRPFESLLGSFEVANGRDFRLGLEYSASVVSLRAGYTPQGFTFGGGFLFRRQFSLDLAVLNSSDLGLSQRISLGYRFGVNKPKKLTGFASEYLENGLAEIERRDYLRASRDIETALGIDPAVGGGQWKRKSARLRELIEGLDLAAQPKDQDELRTHGTAADLAYRSVKSLIDGELPDAMLLAHVAAGSAHSSDSVFMRALQTLSKITAQAIVREDILSVGAFLQQRVKKANEELYARRFGTAIRACRDSVLIQPDSELPWVRLGSAYFAAGDRESARSSYAKALAINPNDQKLQEFYRMHFKE